MANIRSGWKQKLILTAVSCLIVLALLGLGEIYCRLFTNINFLENSRGLFTYKRFGQSYGNTPNFQGVSFGQTFYTDGEGMRIDPTFRSTAANDADGLLLMGDSVAFGPALTDDVTVAGDLRRWMPNTKVMNGAAIGYDSFDYKNATLAFLADHPEVKTVVLIMCLNDISDASAQAIRSQNGQTSDGEPDAAPQSIPRRVNDYLRSRSKLFLWLKNVLVDTQLYYYKFDLAGYQKGEENVSNSLRPIVELDRELKDKGIALKVFVSPYEAQVRAKPADDSQLPQQLITSILTKNGVENYDLAPDFARSAPNTNSLFLYGDPMHLSASGCKVAATAICSKIGGCTAQ